MSYSKRCWKFAIGSFVMASATIGLVVGAEGSGNKAKVAAADTSANKSAHVSEGQAKSDAAALTKTTFAAPRAGEIALDNVNVRSGPGTGEKVIGIMRNHDRVVAVAQVGDWLEIEYPSKISAWVSKDYVDVVGKADGVRIGKINSPRVRIRASGDMTGKVLREASRGEEVRIVGETGLWYKVAAPAEARCYVHKSCVQLEEPPAAPQQAEVAARPETKAAPAVQEKGKEAHAEDVETTRKPEENAAPAIPSVGTVVLASAPKTDPLVPVAVENKNEASGSERASKSEDAASTAKTAVVASSARVPQLPADGGFLSDGILEKPLVAPSADIKYRLTKGGITTYYVKASGEGVNLDGAVGRLVGIKGRILPPPKGFAHQVILAESVTVAE
jgi:uncharacterized protein YgiM (DUF1202 family)